MPLQPRVQEPALMHLLYLHGFMSSAQSSKARFFAERFAALGLTVHCPDLNEPDFATLTATRMIGQVHDVLDTLAPGPVALIGSSLGGFVAWHAAASRQAAAERHAGQDRARISRLVLLAPAFDFGRAAMPELGEEGLRQWKDTGWRPFHHYAYGETRRVHYELYEDAQRYDSMTVSVAAPALVFQGRRDTVVDPAMVRRVAAAHPAITLRELDDDHQLHATLDIIWTETVAFLGLPAD